MMLVIGCAYFDLCRSSILTYSGLAIGVEKHAFEEDKALDHMAKIWLSRDAIVDGLPFKI